MTTSRQKFEAQLTEATGYALTQYQLDFLWHQFGHLWETKDAPLEVVVHGD